MAGSSNTVPCTPDQLVSLERDSFKTFNTNTNFTLEKQNYLHQHVPFVKTSLASSVIRHVSQRRKSPQSTQLQLNRLNYLSFTIVTAHQQPCSGVVVLSSSRQPGAVCKWRQHVIYYWSPPILRQITPSNAYYTSAERVTSVCVDEAASTGGTVPPNVCWIADGLRPIDVPSSQTLHTLTPVVFSPTPGWLVDRFKSFEGISG